MVTYIVIYFLYTYFPRCNNRVIDHISISRVKMSPLEQQKRNKKE